MMPEVHRSFCRFCHANCAMLVTVDEGRVVKVEGDPEDPVYRGYTCIKGRQLPEAHHGPQRLTVSRKRSGAGFEDIDSETALDEIAEKLSSIIAEHGPHAVALYAGTYAFQNSAAFGAAQAFAQGLGTRNFYTSVTLDQPAKVYTAFQYGQWMGGLHSFADADVVFLIGNNPIVSHFGPPGGLPPFSPSRTLRDALARGVKVIVADPRESDVARLASLYLPVRPGEDPALLAGIIHVILEEGLYDKGFVQQFVDGLDELRRAVAAFPPEVAAARAGVEVDQLVAAARLFAGGKRGAVSAGTGPEMSGQGTLTQYLISSLNILCGRFYREGEKSAIPRVFTPVDAPRRAQVAPPMKLWGEGYAASRIRGLTQLGFEMPCNVLADEILTPGEGQVRALVSIGGNPLVAFPDQAKMTRAIDSLDLLVSIDVNGDAATARRSHYVLAPTLSLEREDITNLSEWWHEIPYARYAEALIAPPPGLLDEWEMIWGLAHRLGTTMTLPGGPCPMDVRPTKEEFLDLMVAGCLVPPSKVRADQVDGRAVIYADLNPVVEAGDPDSAARFDLAGGAMPERLIHYAKDNAERTGESYPFRLVSRRSRHRYNSTGQNLSVLVAKRKTNPAFINPDDMARIACRDGDIVRIRSASGELVAVARAAANMRPGVVSMAHAFAGPEVSDAEVRERGSSTNRLISDTEGFDPITGMAVQSAIPVSIVRA